jgi:hypothetical protein
MLQLLISSPARVKTVERHSVEHTIVTVPSSQDEDDEGVESLVVENLLVILLCDKPHLTTLKVSCGSVTSTKHTLIDFTVHVAIPLCNSMFVNILQELI